MEDLDESGDPIIYQTATSDSCMFSPERGNDKRAISFRNLIDTDIPLVSHAFSGERLGPLDPETVEWKSHLRTVKAWLEECGSKHECEAVSSSTQQATLPTRVLHITDSSIKLVDTNGVKGQYIALSYCWGRGQALTTTTSNILIRRAGIDLSECPPTVRDAIITCREVGCNYLWIDAMCIIQDLLTDWETEAATMMDVYAHSWLTIIAEAADSTECGFLHGREFGLMEEKKPLDKRGWAFQENLLATRRLTYHHDSLSFECRVFRDGHNFLDSCRELGRGHNGAKLIYDVWELVVREYSSRYLTMESDISPALSGLSTLTGFASTAKPSYLAGLWDSNFLPGLLWNTEEEVGPLRPDLTAYRAPSWSWASHNGRVSYLTGNVGSTETYLAELIAAETRPKGKNPLGEVSEGFAIIRSLLSCGQISRGESESSPDELFEEEDSWIFQASQEYDTKHQTSDVSAAVFLDDSRRVPNGSLSPAFLLLIRMDEESDGEGHDRGLVLKSANQEEEKYQRIGTFISSSCDRYRYCFCGPRELTII